MNIKMENTVTEIERRLTIALEPSFISIKDDSQAHKNHAQARLSGGGHFNLTIVSKHFEGKQPVARHRLVYNALEGMIGPDIHALQINAKTPEESETGLKGNG